MFLSRIRNSLLWNRCLKSCISNTSNKKSMICYFTEKERHAWEDDCKRNPLIQFVSELEKVIICDSHL